MFPLGAVEEFHIASHSLVQAKCSRYIGFYYFLAIYILTSNVHFVAVWFCIFSVEICEPEGSLLQSQHGFARNMNWSIAESENVDGNPIITLELKDGPYSRSMWDYGFQMLYKVGYLTVLTFRQHNENKNLWTYNWQFYW